MSISIDSLIHEIREQSGNVAIQGLSFEDLALKYFQHDAQQQQTLDIVQPYSTWAHQQGKPTNDIGIDLVASLRDGGYCAIQAKCYASKVQLNESITSSFFAVATADKFKRRILIDTTEREVSSWVADRLNQDEPPGQRVDLTTLRQSSIDWSTILEPEPRSRQKKQPRPHQNDALKAVCEGFESHDRGQLIMACGTGKTYTGLLVAESIVGAGGYVLVLVPSLALMTQTVAEWSNDATVRLRSYAICSDKQVGRFGKKRLTKNNEDEIKVDASDLVIPATTNGATLAASANKIASDCMTVVFATYQSLNNIEAAQKEHGLPEFDLIICDEAHRTTGQIKSDKEASNFVIVHDQSRIRGKKRLYMTATPKIYGEGAQKKAEERGGVELASMADESRFGPLFFHRGFAWAIENDLLVDYKVVVLTVPEAEVSRAIQQTLANPENELTLDVTTKIVGCYKALMKESEDPEEFEVDPEPCRRALSFCSTIARSQLIQKTFDDVILEYLTNEDANESDEDRLICMTEHVDGSTPSKTRSERLAWLAAAHEREDECRVLTNVRCLSEGVDVPALDAILFFDARQSQIDVVQALGRVMRKSPGKKLGYVILPIAVPAGVTPAEALNDNERYKVVWSTLSALRSHDERIEGMIAGMQLGEDPGDRLTVIYSGLGSAATIEDFRESPQDPGEIRVPPPPTPPEPVDPIPGDRELGLELADAIFAKVVDKCGVLNTWTDWAKDVANIARHHITRLSTIVEDPNNRDVFDQFLAELRDDLNDSITEADAVEMLAQHLVTKPVFDAIFQGDQFTSSNSVSQAMDHVIEALGVEHLEKERTTLDEFYRSVRTRAAEVTSSHGKQELIRTLYEKFFQSAFSKLTQRLGIVYTPVEAVDFILHSVDDVLHEHFGVGIGSPGVNVLDPFAGTGTFLTRLLDAENGFVEDRDLPNKYTNNIHSNEIVPLAYYIAGINIESTYHDRLLMSEEGTQTHTEREREYQPFDGICLADTFQSTETGGGVLNQVLPRNHERLERQLNLPIEVVVANPPYSVGQRIGDDNAQNIRYEHSDKRIRDTYIARVKGASLVNSMYDTYIRAFRWASDRIKGNGVIGFITNAGWLESVAGSGIRACFHEEFSRIYVLNLRGNARTQGLLRKKEGGSLFGGGSRAAIAITILIKDPKHRGPAEIYYYDIGDYLTTEQKRQELARLRSVNRISWTTLEPDEYDDWLNQRDQRFPSYIPIGDKQKKSDTSALFEMYSSGIKSNRDAWAYNFSREKLLTGVQTTFSFFNKEVDRFELERPTLPIKDWVRYSPTNIAWSLDFFADIQRARKKTVEVQCCYESIYRPFSKRMQYFSNTLENSVYRQPLLFPTNATKNLVICIEDKGTTKPFSCLMVDCVPDLHLMAATQCFPLYCQEQVPNSDQDVLGVRSSNEDEIEDGMQHALSEAGLRYFQKHYPNDPIVKESLFYYIYGILHSSDYRAAYQSNLFKELARIPVVSSYDEFRRFSEIGKRLGDLHVEYESLDLPAIVKVNGELVSGKLIERFDPDELRVSKMRFLNKAIGSAENRTQDKSAIVFNHAITVSDIPASAYEYVVNGRPAIEWIMDQYQIKVDKKTEIKNDPNDYAIEIAGDPAYILKLLLRVITVSLRTNELVAQLPKLRIRSDFKPYEEFRQSVE